MDLRDFRGRPVRLSAERLAHVEAVHPEMIGQANRVAETLAQPDKVTRSNTDPAVELLYRLYASTPVTSKFLCVVVKSRGENHFIVTAYYTDSVKKGEVLWERK